MTSPRDTSLKEEEGADVDGVDRDRAEQEGEVAESGCHDLNCASLHFMVAYSMAQIA